MPIALSSKFTTWASLPLDQDTPEESRLAFQVRFLSSLAARELTAAVDGDPAHTWDQWRQRINAAIAGVLVAVKNATEASGVVPAAFVEQQSLLGSGNVKVCPQLDSLLSDGELRDLGIAILDATRLGYQELKKSKSQRESGAAPSAENAKEAAATLRTKSAP